MSRCYACVMCIFLAMVCGRGETQDGEKTQAAETGKQSVVENTSVADTAGETPRLTVEELAKYDGKKGMPAYVAVDGVIYDMTGLKSWKNGKHQGFSAGKDITEEIKKKSPHGVSVLKKRTVVGKLITPRPAEKK